ncbi:hypothetical protein Tco_0314759, partial [Tanacetum coccineum]
SYESSPSVSPLDLPSQKHYRGTSELVEDKDEGPTAEDEDSATKDKGLTARVEGPDMDDESRGIDDEGHSVESDGLGLEDEEEQVVPGVRSKQLQL